MWICSLILSFWAGLTVFFYNKFRATIFYQVSVTNLASSPITSSKQFFLKRLTGLPYKNEAAEMHISPTPNLFSIRFSFDLIANTDDFEEGNLVISLDHKGKLSPGELFIQNSFEVVQLAFVFA